MDGMGTVSCVTAPKSNLVKRPTPKPGEAPLPLRGWTINFCNGVLGLMTPRDPLSGDEVTKQLSRGGGQARTQGDSQASAVSTLGPAAPDCTPVPSARPRGGPARTLGVGPGCLRRGAGQLGQG